MIAMTTGQGQLPDTLTHTHTHTHTYTYIPTHKQTPREDDGDDAFN